MQIKAVDEFNKGGHLIYASNYVGAYVRGKTREEALLKFPLEISQYCRWLGIPFHGNECSISIIQEKQSDLQICDADSEVIFESEITPLTMAEYKRLKALALKSAQDFASLYRSITVKNKSVTPARKTFYGTVPSTAQEMYVHTKNVNNYYFGEIHVSAENEPDIYTCRLHAFDTLEHQPDFLSNVVFEGSHGEQWSLKKVCRRFVWHDRIHAKAMYRMATPLHENENIVNSFYFV